MTLTQAAVLGTVQGLTEFLPISSSAHLILVPWLLGWEDQGLTFDVVLHAGTLIAILSFFWKDWLGMLLIVGPKDPLMSREAASPWLLFLIICGTIPAAAAGFFGQRMVETQLRSPLILAMAMIGVALLLWLAEKKAA